MRRLRYHAVVLASILGLRQDAQISRDVETADDRIDERHDVIDFVLDASVASQAVSFIVETLYLFVIGPCRRGAQFLCSSARNLGTNAMRMFPRPFCGQRFYSNAIALSPGLSLEFVFSVVRTSSALALFFWKRVVEALALCSYFVWMRTPPRVLSSEVGLFLQRVAGSLSGKYFFVMRRMVAAVLLRPRHGLASMWASMMRRTSSAIEIPRRLASRFKKARCGSVNEIICLVIGVRLVEHRAYRLGGVFERIGQSINLAARLIIELQNVSTLVPVAKFINKFVETYRPLDAIEPVVHLDVFDFVDLVTTKIDNYQATFLRTETYGIRRIERWFSYSYLAAVGHMFNGMDGEFHNHSIPQGIQCVS